MANSFYKPDDQGIELRYNIIIAKLRATIEHHRLLFPDLPEIDSLIEQLQAAPESNAGHLQRLQKLCAHLQELSISSHAIRHLHYNLCADVEAVENKNFKITQETYYITLPK